MTDKKPQPEEGLKGLFNSFVEEYTRREMSYHERYETTGLEFAWECWKKAFELGWLSANEGKDE